MQSENTPTDATPEGDAEVIAAPGLANLAELLDQGEQPDTNENPEGDNGAAAGDGNNAKPVKFNDLADATGLELDDLYQLQVTTTDGKAVTVEELKSLALKQDEIALNELEQAEQHEQQSAELRKAQNELTELIAQLPKGALKPEVLEGIRQKHTTLVNEERARTLEAIPAWKDDKTRETESAGMIQHLQNYGFPPGYLNTVVDHRMLAFIRASHLREQRINAALKKVRAGAPNPTTPSKPSAGKTAPKKTGSNSPRNGLQAFLSDVE